MFAFLKRWDKEADAAFKEIWRGSFAAIYIRWVLNGQTPALNNAEGWEDIHSLTDEQINTLNLAIEQNFVAYMYGAGSMWISCSAVRLRTSTSKELMDETVIEMYKMIESSNNPAKTLIGFITDRWIAERKKR